MPAIVGILTFVTLLNFMFDFRWGSKDFFFKFRMLKHACLRAFRLWGRVFIMICVQTVCSFFFVKIFCGGSQCSCHSMDGSWMLKSNWKFWARSDQTVSAKSAFGRNFTAFIIGGNLKHDHTDDVFMVATLKQNKTKQANPNPKDVRLGALSYWQRFLVAKFFFQKKAS